MDRSGQGKSNVHGNSNSDIDLLLSDPDTDGATALVRFDIGRMAVAFGVSEGELMLRMVHMLAVAIAMDAAELADAQMREHGERLAVDGYPPGWPDDHLVQIARLRLYPETLAAGQRAAQ